MAKERKKVFSGLRRFPISDLNFGGIYDMTVTHEGQRLYFHRWDVIQHYYPALDFNTLDDWWTFWTTRSWSEIDSYETPPRSITIVRKQRPLPLIKPLTKDRLGFEDQYGPLVLFVRHSRSLKSAAKHFGKYGYPPEKLLETVERTKEFNGKPMPKFQNDWDFKKKDRGFCGDWYSIEGIDLHSRYMDDPHPDEYIPGYTEFWISTYKYATAEDLAELDR